MRKYMVVEKYRAGCIDAIYERHAAQGRMLPDGLFYLHSWLDAESLICFQLMETADRGLFDEWAKHWDDLVAFEIHALD